MLNHMEDHRSFGLKMTDEWPAGHALPIVPDYSHSESMCDLTKREYRAELEARAAEGDKYAASALDDLNAGKRVQNDDPAGS